jgi:hypothetical protein
MPDQDRRSGQRIQHVTQVGDEPPVLIGWESGSLRPRCHGAS